MTQTRHGSGRTVCKRRVFATYQDELVSGWLDQCLRLWGCFRDIVWVIYQASLFRDPLDQTSSGKVLQKVLEYEP